MLTVTATLGLRLQGAVKEALGKLPQADGCRTIVLEDRGIPATLGLKQRDPFRADGCSYGDPNCNPDPKIDCGQQDMVYVITCNGCKDPVPGVSRDRGKSKPTDTGGEARPNYVDMTGTSLHARSKGQSTSVR